MTFNERGLIRAMKNAYREQGYSVAGTEDGYTITGEMWGVSIHDKAVPNTVKSLIVLHAGKLPDVGKAISVRKGEVCSEIYEMAVDRIESFRRLYREGKQELIRPTRLTLDGYRLWQNPRTFAIKMIDPVNQQILDFTDNDAYLICDTLYGETVYGSVFVHREVVAPEDLPMLAHLEQMQWIPVELE